jgi:hypothetical protein
MMNIFNMLGILLALALLNSACSDGGNHSSTPSYAIALEFTRIDRAGLDPFQVTATVREDGQLKTGIASDISISLVQGSADSVSEASPGVYQFSVTPSQTGEYPVTVSYQDSSATRSALVLADVDPAWGQPMAVSGLVNTAGYEDGITITPDGQYLFVQYGPIFFSGILLFNTPRANGGCEGNRLEYPAGTPNRCTHTWLDNTIGPYTAPQRPGFFSGRIANDGTLLHNANSWGVGTDQAPIFAPSTMFYGFKRQADGSFAEPFYIAFADEDDALINPGGLSFMLHGDGTATILFFLDDADASGMVDVDGDGNQETDSLHDIYTADITLGQDNILGTYVYSGTPGSPPIRSSDYSATLVNFGKTGIKGIEGTQGNPHLYENAGVIQSIWTDDERDDPSLPGVVDRDGDFGQISVYLLDSGAFPNGSWTKLTLPTPVNQPSPSNEIQPFFTGSGLYFTHGSDTQLPEVYYAAYSGSHNQSDLATSSNWGTPRKILGLGATDSIGQVTAIGEPTIANDNGSEYLYFVYGVIRGFDSTSGLADINMQAGYVKKR